MALRLVFGLLFFSLCIWDSDVIAAVAPSSKVRSLSGQLTDIRSQVVALETGLLSGVKSQNLMQSNVKKIRELLKLQREERAIGRKRMAELEKTIHDLEDRRGTLTQRISEQRTQVRALLRSLKKASDDTAVVPADPLELVRNEKLEAPRRVLLARMAGRGLKELEALRVDVADAEMLEGKIQEEKEQLVYLFQDLNEKESVLELSQKLQLDILRKKHQDRVAQLENYRKLKHAEAQVETLLGEFNARLELEQTIATERAVSKAMMQSAFAQLKGKIPAPVLGGKIVGRFGKAFDQKSGLYVFKKGVDIASENRQAVKAVAPGRVAFSGELPDYGRVAIIDHGQHFYTLVARLGSLAKAKGDAVDQGDSLGETDDRGTPVYFEVRAKNVAVNPLQWLAN